MTLVQTLATIDVTENQQYSQSINDICKDEVDSSSHCRRKATPEPGPIFHKCLTPDPDPKKMKKRAGVDSGSVVGLCFVVTNVTFITVFHH